jgi:hypothetical protein
MILALFLPHRASTDTTIVQICKVWSREILPFREIFLSTDSSKSLPTSLTSNLITVQEVVLNKCEVR